MPDTLRHKVTVRLKAERRVEAAIAFGGQGEVENVLNETFITAALVGKPLSVGHFVNSKPAGGLAFNTITHTYSPYILIGQNDGNIEDDEIIRGTDYQEVITNFPLGNQLLTGLFLEMDVKSPDGKIETHERALVDRIGFVARQNGGTATINISDEAANKPAIGPLDLITINVLSGLQSLDAIAPKRDNLTPLKTELEALKPLVEQIPPTGPTTLEQQRILARALDLSRQSTLIGAEAIGMVFARASDVALKQLEQGFLTRGYYTSPRLLVCWRC